ncbi:MAG TPA: TonB-dependent receptor, partial [Myxococcota bacterium]|nr:TonB-dependent receptor [Myxococcota bacterium]
VPEKPPHLEGVVLRDDGAPVADAAVQVDPGTLLTRADARGRFILTLPRAGSYVLRIAGVGVLPMDIPIEAHADETVHLKLTAKTVADGATRYESLVRSKAPAYEISRQQLSRDELRAVPGAFGDPLRVLESLPGLGRSPFASGILVMRGSSPDDSAVYLDNHTIPLLYHFGGGPSIVPPEAIGGLNLQPGSFSARYGRATAGLVAIETRPGHGEAFHGGAHVSILDAGATLEGPLGSPSTSPTGSFRVAARRSYIDTLLPLLSRTVGVGANSSLTLTPRYYDYLARVDMDAFAGAKLSLLANGSDDALSFANTTPPFSLPTNFDLNTSIHRVNPRLIATLTPEITLDVSPSVSWLDNRGQTPYAFSDLRSRSQALRTELRSRVAPGKRLILGADFLRDDNTFSAALPSPVQARDFPAPSVKASPTTQKPGHLVVFQGAIYSEVEVQLGAGSVYPGVRLEHARHGDRAQTTFDPRLAGRVALTDAVAFKAALGVYHRLPLPDQISIDTGNPALGFERSLQSTLGFEFSFDTAHSLDIQAYGKWMDNLTVRSGNVIATLTGLVPERYTDTGEGRVVGAEILLRRKLSKGIMGWLAYSISKSERRSDSALPFRLYARDQTHNFNGVLSVELPFDMHVGGRLRYVTGYPVFPIVGAVYDADANAYAPQQGGSMIRLPAFAQLDLRWDMQFGSPDGPGALVFLDVQNVTNRTNAEYYQYSQDYSQRYAYPGLPFLPSVGVEVRY